MNLVAAKTGQVLPASVTNHGVGILATTDSQAIYSWLQEYRYNDHTYLKYELESNRFAEWLCANKLELKALKKDHLHLYIEHLEKMLTVLGVKYNLRIINGLLNYLVEAGYLEKNPLKLIKKKIKDWSVNRVLQVRSRILEPEELSAVIAALNGLPTKTTREIQEKLRVQLMVGLFYHLGLRVFELCNARWSNFKMHQGRVWYFLIGKGNKPGQIPVNKELLVIVNTYREFYKMPLELNKFADELIFRSAKTGSGISGRRVCQIIKTVFSLAASKIKDEHSKAKLLKASPHDFRHILASNLDSLGLSIIETKDILRHRSEKTTEIYRHSLESKRHAAIQLNVLGLKKVELMQPEAQYLQLEVRCDKNKVMEFCYFLRAVNSYLNTPLSAMQEDELIARFKAAMSRVDILTIQIPFKHDEVTASQSQVVFARRAAESRGIDLINARCPSFDYATG